MSSSPGSSRSPPRPTNTKTHTNGEAETDATTPKTALSNGVFRNGVWYCNCPEKRCATVQRVRKANENYGKTFYGCPINPNTGNSCKFFLLTEEAKMREKECFLSNHRSETGSTPRFVQKTLHETFGTQTGRRTQRQQEVAGNASPSVAPIPLSFAPAHPTSTASLGDAATKPREAPPPPHGVLYDGGSSEEEEEEVVEIPSPTKHRGAKAKPTNGPPSSAMSGTPRGQSKEFKRRRSPSVEQEDLLDDLSSGAEEELIAVTDRSTRHYNVLGKRPEKIQHDADITPTAPRFTNAESSSVAGLPTPSHSVPGGRSLRKGLLCREDYESIGSPSITKASNPRMQKISEDELKTKHTAPGGFQSSSQLSQSQEASRLFGTDRTVPTSPNATFASSASTVKAPTPHGSRIWPSTAAAAAAAAAATSGPVPGSSGGKDLTQEVMDTLKDEKLSDAGRKRLREILRERSAHVKDLESGHARLSAQNKKLEFLNARLLEKVARLEDGRRELKTRILDAYQSY